MGTASSKDATTVAGHYDQLITSMMNNRLTFDVNTRNIAEVESQWFQNLEERLKDKDTSSEDVLYETIRDFVASSEKDINEAVRGIEDRELQNAAKKVLEKTRTAVAMQKYYEYKYLHLSAVFIHFTDFVHKLMDVMSQTVQETTRNHSAGTAGDIGQLVEAIQKAGLTEQQETMLKKSVKAVHESSESRLADLSRRLSAVTSESATQALAFPAAQLEQQKKEEKTQPQQPQQPLDRNPDVGNMFQQSGGSKRLITRMIAKVQRAGTRRPSPPGESP
nr:hypothetical protein TetV2_00163 [Oceanusvirus sp.]